MLKTQVIGNLGRDSVVREVNGSHALNFTVAHNERVITGDGEVIDKTIWVNCTRWMRKPTELSKYLKKGTLVFVSGTPDTKIYTDKDGIRKVDFRLKVDSIELLSSGEKKKERSMEEIAAEQKAKEEKAEREVQEALAD